ncbi:aromatic/alkene monooxygenase hydroxylase subunit beta [Candidatus Mycolicibacterium alkanivorans]|uniref:propane 2-monooxygenase n=1 Tax=Candidatus Mycolicibacterium alkanivorans TaxID=2954114 RepID=A0ABS9YYX9_9MYCO|nr:aromatic/alkene monooxygenase hydroxylase subunit beta [Candidatus Mycolicibacterium alkanivorans]MCI4676456.1 aromatic/alkene monooxygenase hydroxylase subunit beta [Candidatus Mycolicibacterium alkanivorans]
MTAMLPGTVDCAGKPTRDFTYIPSRRRRLSEYEAVTCFAQPDVDGFDQQGWLLRDVNGRTPWIRESTALVHPNWFLFRDPASHWQRTYVRMQAEQERAIARSAEDAAADGVFNEFDPVWTREILGRHYRAWAYAEYGLFRAFAVAQREALSDTLGNVFCFEAFDRMRHAQDIVLHLLELEDHVDGFADDGAKAVWLEDQRYQPTRRLVEELVAGNDWGELAIVTNLVFDPILTELAVSQLVRRFGPFHGDPVTPHLVGTTERDRRRNLAWTQEFVRIVTDPTVPECQKNAATITDWLDSWTPRVHEAAKAMADVYDLPPLQVARFDDVFAVAQRTQQELVAGLNLKVGAAA